MHKSTLELLAGWESLPYPERMRALARHARVLRDSGRLAETVADLRGGGVYERWSAVMMAVVTGDAEAVATATGDADGRIRATAVRGGLRTGLLGAPELIALVTDAPADLRRLVIRSLRGARRPGLADALMDVIRERYGDREAAGLLPACGAETVARLLPQLEHAVGNWAALARSHPAVVVDHAGRELGRLTAASRAAWWRRCGAGVLRAAAYLPERVLDVLEEFGPSTHLPGPLTAYGELAAAEPGRVLRLLTAPARAPWLSDCTLPNALLDRLGRLDVADLALLAQRLRDCDVSLARLLEAVAPRHREALYDAAMTGVDTGQFMVSDVLMEALPRGVQEREARRILALPRIRDDEAAKLRHTVYLPWAEAQPVLVAATRRADPQDRATGYELLLAAARRGREPATADALDQLGRLRNEQDPVRAPALRALARTARLLTARSVDALTRLVTDAVEARDTSGAALSALSGLAVTVIRYHVDEPVLVRWALETLDRLSGGYRVPPLGRLDTALRRGQEREVFAVVRPWIEAGMARGEFEGLFAVARALGRRARLLPGLQSLLNKAINRRSVEHVFRRAVALWLDDPSTRAQRAAEVLRVDSSAVTLDEVWRAVCTRRTDLLDGLLLGSGPTGKFITKGVRWVPGYAPHMQRWLPRHRQAFADLQARIAADAGAKTYARTAAIAAAARVPEYGWPVVERYLDSANTNLAEAALGALGWTDRPADALPVLLAHVDGDRARVAMYAATRAARFVAPTELAAMLGGIAAGPAKVTSRKEALRLLASFGPPSAMGQLLAVWRQEGLHSDVRAAIVAAARRRLDHPAGWQILDEAAAGGREDMLAALAAVPGGLPESDRERYAALVVRLCGSVDRVAARTAWAHLAAWGPWLPDLAGTLTAAATRDDPDEWLIIATAIGRLLDHDPSVLGPAFDTLVRLDAADDDPGGPAHDRPARRRLAVLVNRATAWADGAGPEADRTAVGDHARTLARTSTFTPLAARLLTHLVRLDAPTPDDLVATLTEIATLVAGQPVTAGRLADLIAHRLQRGAGTWHEPTVATAAATLAGRESTAEGLFAVALARAGEPLGWPPAWRDLLHRLRQHTIADVHTAALDISMA